MNNGPIVKRSGMMRRGGETPAPVASRKNIAVEVRAYDLASPTISTPDKDFLVGALLHDVEDFGLKAEFVEEGPENERVLVPKTEVRVMMPLRSGGGNRRDIFALSRRRSGGPAMDVGSRVVFERCAFDKENNTILAQFSHGAASSQQLKDGSRIFVSNMLTCVLPEKWNKSPPNKGWAGKTSVLIADVNEAATITSEDDLREHIAFVLENSALGTPGFILLCRGLCPSGVDPSEFASNPDTRVGKSHVMTPQRISGRDGVTWRQRTSEEVFVNFKNTNPGLVSRIGRHEFLIEFVPMVSVNQARSLVPSNATLNSKGKDNALTYGIFDFVSENDVKNMDALYPTRNSEPIIALVDVAWAPSHVVIDRQPLTNGGELVFSSYQAPCSSGSLVSLDDIVTANMPAYHVEAVKREAEKLFAMRQKYWATLRVEKTNEPQEANEPAGYMARR
jgi:hypothetical protein